MSASTETKGVKSTTIYTTLQKAPWANIQGLGSLIDIGAEKVSAKTYLLKLLGDAFFPFWYPLTFQEALLIGGKVQVRFVTVSGDMMQFIFSESDCVVQFENGDPECTRPLGPAWICKTEVDVTVAVMQSVHNVRQHVKDRIGQVISINKLKTVKAIFEAQEELDEKDKFNKLELKQITAFYESPFEDPHMVAARIRDARAAIKAKTEQASKTTSSVFDYIKYLKYLDSVRSSTST